MNKTKLSTLILWGLLVFTPTIFAQDVTDAANSIALARLQSTLLVSVTASSGDGTACLLNKLSGSKINMSFSCSRTGISFKTGAVSIASPAIPTALPVGFGDVLCLVGANPTLAAITMGSLGSVPANGISWNCTTNITAGGQTPIVSGTANWP